MRSFFRFVNKRGIYRLDIISLAHAQVHVTDFPVVNVHVDELSSARIWQHKLCATFSANINVNYRLPIKVIYIHAFCMVSSSYNIQNRHFDVTQPFQFQSLEELQQNIIGSSEILYDIYGESF